MAIDVAITADIVCHGSHLLINLIIVAVAVALLLLLLLHKSKTHVVVAIAVGVVVAFSRLSSASD